MPVTITSKREGFRRCGAAHGKAPAVYPGGHWTEEQLEILRAEPMLTVKVTEDKTDPPVKPTGEALDQAIAEAIGKLDRENRELWTKDGRPQVSSIEDVLGYQITAAERDQAWGEA